ncbi:protein hedgehog, partial [Condylostylus longicornis]|uniref:protein hedgehog n=1 Tax=Condylostylus longicornis TaxID=2530218 RepID=UPI00244E35A2
IILLTILQQINACGPGRGLGGPRRSRRLVPLVFKQHVPNVSEYTLGASGLREGKVDRNSSKFKNLVPNYNKDIIFKDEEGTGADRIMSQRCKEKLNTLAVLVMNRWPGQRLRVTESWDEDMKHGNESLHYEGRAVDITTSDRDRSKYGMLARLAVEAGFDWVYYESREHIHCSVKSDSTQKSHVSGCFTSESTVQISTGERRRLSDLKLGEKVLSMTSNGKTKYSEVIMFLDYNMNEIMDFVQITTKSGAILTVTAAHLIMVWNLSKNQSEFRFASKIEEGDFVLVYKDDRLRPEKVIKITLVHNLGYIAPLTREGTIIVDSIAASCYALIDSQSIAHWSFSPIRAYLSMKNLLGFSSRSYSSSSSGNSNSRSNNRRISDNKLNNIEINNNLILENDNSISNNEILNDPLIQNGVHWYAKILYSIKDWVLPDDWIYH